jgi:outer membrane protein assembly factor BamB
MLVKGRFALACSRWLQSVHLVLLGGAVHGRIMSVSRVPCSLLSSLRRPAAILSLMGLVASVAFSASLAAPASAGPPADEWPPIPLTGTYVGLSPARLMDTRPGAFTVDGKSSGAGAISGGRTMVVPVVGRHGIPAGAVAAVVNITEASATANGFLTLFAAGSSRPGTSNLNFTANHVTSVEATVPLDSNGGIAVYNSAGKVNAAMDVVGYYAGATTAYSASAFHPQAPKRLVDTRHSSALASGRHLPLGLPSLPGATSVALNVTVTGATRAGYVSIWPGVARQSTHTSALNFTAGQTVANMAITTTAANPVNGQRSFSVGNSSAGSVNVIVDVVGFYRELGDGPGGAVFKAIRPTRVVDTRIGKGLPRPLSARQSAAVGTSALFGDVDTVAMVANVTGLNDPSATFLSVHPGGTGVPGTSSLNLAPREVRSNMVMPGLSRTSTRSFTEYNNAGTLDTLVDVVGYFESTGNRRSITRLTSSSASTPHDTALTLTASVTGTRTTPTGTVTFSDASNGSVLAVEPLSGGVARLTTAALAPGVRKIVAAYKAPALTSPSFQNPFAPSVSAALPVTVAPPRSTTATASQNNSRHDGMDTGDTFNPATLHKAWSIDFNPASGAWPANVSYPLIAGDRVFVTVGPSVSPARNENTLYALDATTGSVDWQAPIATYYGVPGLTYDGGQVFVQDFDGNLTAFNAATGRVSWTTALTAGSYTAPPTAYDGVLYASGGGLLTAVSEANGKVVWTASLSGSGGPSSPAVDDSGVYAGADIWCGKVSAFALDGTRRWANGPSACSTSIGATSVLNDGHLFVPGMYMGAEHTPGLIVSAGTGVGSGSLVGQRMPSFDASQMYVVRQVPSGSVLDAMDKTGSQTRWSFTGDRAVTSTPVTTNGIVFTGSVGGNLYGIDSRTGAQVWTAVAPGPVATAVTGGRVTWGLTAADGLLVVPAGGFLTVYTN